MDKPFVSVAAGADIQPPMVHTDEARGVKLILDYLIGLGHCRIAFMGSLAWPLVPERFQLFREYLTESDLTIPDSHVSDVDCFLNEPEEFDALERMHREIIQHTKSLLLQPNQPTAIFCAGDAYALSALKGVAQLGLAVPCDVSVTSFDGTDGTFVCQPELTILRRPLKKVAACALAPSIDSDATVVIVPGSDRRIALGYAEDFDDEAYPAYHGKHYSGAGIRDVRRCSD